MNAIRAAAVAGTFYPAEAEHLRAEVAAYLQAVPQLSDDTPSPKAVIVPHAGFVYSAPIAAAAYARLLPLRGKIRRVVLLGPAHRVPVRGLALSAADSFETPLGQVPLDRQAIEALRALPQVRVWDAPHTAEHSLEVQLPFLQEALGTFALVPLVVGDATAEEVRQVLERLWGGDETLIVISTDLSHYHDYATARQFDIATCAAIEALRPEKIGVEQACGRIPVAGLLLAAKAREMRVETLDLRNSGDTAGPRDQVVGYGAWAVFPKSGLSLSSTDRDALHRAARDSIASGLASGRAIEPVPESYAAALREPGASFVTLEIGGALRGCIGSLQATRPLVVDVAHNAWAAAFRDPRFPPLSVAEFSKVDLHISVLNPPQPLTFANERELLDQLRPGIDGLVIHDGERRATFLPQVWESLPEPAQFLRHLKVKAGLPGGYWSDSFRAERYTVETV